MQFFQLLGKNEIVETSFNTTFDSSFFADSFTCELFSQENHPDLYTHETIFSQLPPNTRDLLHKYRGISQLFGWQEKILQLPCVYTGGNLIYSCPTGGGKTLVSELILMREVLTNHKNSIYVVPYVSLAHEKVSSLAPLGCDLGFHVEEYASSKGCIPPRRRYKRNSIYVATIEKASLLINSMIEEKMIHTIGVIVVDEIHMINEPKRGVNLELMLTKIVFQQLPIQVIGMSATIKNVEDLCMFLNATYFCSTQRPVTLKEYLCIGSDFYHIDSSQNDWKSSKNFLKGLNDKQVNNSQSLGLLLHFVQELNEDQPCLIFCPTKRNCEVTCENITRHKVHKTKVTEREDLLSALEYVTGGVCNILRRSITRGIAYHHAGMADDERKIIEEAYLCGTINVLCCTSTLAAGVNLPAYRVIIKSPKIGISVLTNVYYRQMIGRAGRPGLSEHGESILMITTAEQPLLETLLVNDQVCHSAISYIDEEELATIILFLYQADSSFEMDQIINFFKTTLFYKQLNKNIDVQEFIDKLESAIKLLMERNLIVDKNGLFTLTPIGGLDVKSSKAVYTSLRNSLSKFMLSTDLHLIYICIPNDIETELKEYQITGLNQAELELLQTTGLSECLIYKYINKSHKDMDVNLKLLFNKWFFTLLFYQLYKGKSIWNISAEFEISRGVIQHLIASTVSNAYVLTRYTKELKEFWQINILLEEMVKKLSIVHSAEVIPLLEISGVKLARAKQLYKAGYKTIQEVANASVDNIIKEVSHLSRRQASSIISSAKLLIREQVETLVEMADEILGRCKISDLD